MIKPVSVWPLTALDKGSSLTPAQRIFIDTQTEPPQPRQPLLNSPVSTFVANTLMCLAFSRQKPSKVKALERTETVTDLSTQTAERQPAEPGDTSPNPNPAGGGPGPGKDRC